MSHVRTSPFYPQSNGKLERYHKTIKSECIRPKVALSLEEARNQIADYISFYNDERLHSAIGYIAPKDKLEGRDTREIRDVVQQQQERQVPHGWHG
jgi:transposase InsO family protein